MIARRIYIVEDEALIAMELQDHLERLGYAVCGHTARGAHALREIPDVKPDLVLMDINLGPGISGIEVAERLRGRVDVPVVFLTAYADAELAERATRTDASAYIIKPFQPHALRANIEMALYKRDASRRLDEQASELSRSLSLLHATLDATTDGVLIDGEGELRAANRAFAEMWGLGDEAPLPQGDELRRRLCPALCDPDALLAEHAEGRGCDRLHLVDGRVLERRVRTREVDGRPLGRVLSFRDVTAPLRAEERLRESEERFRRVVEHISDAVVVADRDGRLLFTNDRFAELLGVDPAAAPEIRLSDHVAAPWRDVVEAHRRDRMSGAAGPASVIYRALTADGAPLWIESTVTAIVAADGQASATQSVLRDITERRETEEALRILSSSATRLAGDALLADLARQLARLLEAEVGLAVACAPDGAIARTIGLWVDDGSPPSPLPLGDLPLDAAAAWPTIVEAGACARWPASRALAALAADGLALAPLLDSSGRRIGAIGVAARRPLRRPARVAPLLGLFAALAAANLERQREQAVLHDLFEHAPDAVLMVNVDGAILRANIRALELLGYARSELLGRTIDHLLPEPQRRDHARLRQAFHARPSARSMGSLKEPLRALRRDGESIPVDISLGPVRTDEGLVVIAVLRDLRAHVAAEERRRALEHQLRHSQKLEALGTLAGGIAHDFNNILAAITANLELARIDVGREHPAATYLEDIAAATRRATLLVRQILAFGRRQPPRRAVIALAPVVREAAQLLRRALPARIALDLVLDPGAPPILADATQIHQVLMNLGTNAAHAIADGPGVITIALAHDPADGDDRGHVRLSVRDTGCGIDPADLDRIFEPFFTTKPVGEGTGLGLSVVHGIICEHGGELRVESQPGRGTTVSARLPAAEEPAPPPPAPAEPIAPAAEPWRIAVLDDDPVLALIGEALLTHLGHRATSFVDPAAAIAAIRADPLAFDLVITDFNMPSISGVDLIAALAAVRPDLPIILVSGHTGRTDEELARAGVRHRLDKPFELADLHRLIRAVQREQAGRS